MLSSRTPCSRHAPRADEREVLAKTYLLVSQILKQIDSTEIADNRLIVQRVLRWVTWAKPALSLQELQEAVAINPGDEELDSDVITTESDILDLCSSLVRCNPSGTIELAHATVKEFLTAIPSTSEYHFYRVDERSDMTELAVTCLTYLCLDNFGEEKNWDSFSVSSGTQSMTSKASLRIHKSEQVRDLEYHFMRHAAENWDLYAEKITDKGSHVLALERTLFAPAKTPQFINWARRRLKPGRYKRHWNEENLLADCTTLQWASLLALPDTCQWLIDQGSDVNRATSVLGSPLACAVLGESILHHQSKHGSDSGSEDGNSDNNNDYIVKESGPWHPEKRYKTIEALLSRGARLDGMPSEESKSLMEFALMVGEPSHIKLLLSHGAVLDTDCLVYLEKHCSEGPRQAEMQQILGAISKVNYAPPDAPKATKLQLAFEKSSVQVAKLLADTLEASKSAEGTDAQNINLTLCKVAEYGRKYWGYHLSLKVSRVIYGRASSSRSICLRSNH